MIICRKDQSKLIPPSLVLWVHHLLLSSHSADFKVTLLSSMFPTLHKVQHKQCSLWPCVLWRLLVAVLYFSVKNWLILWYAVRKKFPFRCKCKFCNFAALSKITKLSKGCSGREAFNHCLWHFWEQIGTFIKQQPLRNEQEVIFNLSPPKENNNNNFIIPNLFSIIVKILTTIIIDVHHEKVLPERFDLCTLVHVCLGNRELKIYRFCQRVRVGQHVCHAVIEMLAMISQMW